MHKIQQERKLGLTAEYQPPDLFVNLPVQSYIGDMNSVLSQSILVSTHILNVTEVLLLAVMELVQKSFLQMKH